jgi:ABC-type uncharacterized transport system permease subunit
MDTLAWLSLARRTFPTLVAAVLAVALIAFPHTADSLLSQAIHTRAKQITSELRRVTEPALKRMERRPEPSARGVVVTRRSRSPRTR